MNTEQVSPANVTTGTDAKDVAPVPTGNPDQQPKELTRQSNVTMKRTKTPLNRIKMDPGRFCHRDDSSLQEASLQPLINSLAIEGMQVPIEGYFDKDGTFLVVKGHCRVMSHLILVRKNTPGFTPDMELDAIELQNYTPQDLLVRSVSDNEVRQNLDRVGRIRAAKKLYDGGVEEGRAAAALGISTKTYERDVQIAQNAWMFQHIIDGSIEATAASDLLAAAAKTQRVKEVKEDLDAWIADKKRTIREKARQYKLQSGKELAPAERLVKRQLPRYLVDHWIELIEKANRFDDDAEWEFGAHLDKEKGQLHIASVNLDLDKAPVEQLAQVASKLSQLSKQMAPVLQQRLAENRGGTVNEEPPYDLDYLKQLGATDLADRFQQRLQKAKAEETDGENLPQELPAPRNESDLSAEVQLPPAGKDKTEAGEQPAR